MNLELFPVPTFSWNGLRERGTGGLSSGGGVGGHTCFDSTHSLLSYLNNNINIFRG
jgi:hypothetical protein